MKNRTGFRLFAHKFGIAVLGFLLGLIAFFAWGAIVFASPAKADVTDDIYLVTIHDHGIHLASDDFELQLAHAVCNDVRGGTTMMRESIHLAAIATDPELTLNQASYVVGAAAASYCPEVDPYIGASSKTGWVS